MKKLPLILSLLVSFFFVFSASAFAQQGIAGDALCGGTATSSCKLSHVTVIISRVIELVVAIGLPILIVVIAYRFTMAWFAVQRGNANAYKEALYKSTQALIGFVVIISLFGGLFLGILKYFGVQSFPLQLLELFKSTSTSFQLIPHAYAETAMLPNPLKATSLYDVIMSIVRTAIVFFIYPALIIAWVWTGFAFVASQGNPEGLKKAKTYLLRAFITTLVIFMIQGFLMAVQGTVKKILGSRDTAKTVSVVAS